MSAEIEQAETQDDETLPGLVCASALAFVRGTHSRLPAEPWRTPSPAFRVREETRKVIWCEELSFCFQRKNISFFFMPHGGEESWPGLPG